MSIQKKKDCVYFFKSTLPLRETLTLIGLSSNAWYYKKQEKKEDLSWKERIESILLIYPYYGERRIRQELKRNGFTINKKKCKRIMKIYALCPRKRKKQPHVTDSRHRMYTYPNKIQEITITHKNHLWVGDVTYVKMKNHFLYVSMLKDVFTKEIVGYSIKNHHRSSLVVESLRNALADHGPPEYHHSDRGGEYCSEEYITHLLKKDIEISMAQKGLSIDNAYAETFFKSLKVEEVYLKEYENDQEAIEEISQYITLYNTRRLHSKIGYRPPEEFSALIKNKIIASCDYHLTIKKVT